MARSEPMQAFLSAAEAALARVTGEGADVARKVTDRWQVAAAAGTNEPATLPVCDWIAPALSGNTGALAAAFAALVPGLRWQRRSSATPAEPAFWNGHANAVVVGPGGLEDRADIWIGATVMPPDTLYPNHSHPPAEVYLPLTPGQWWNARMDWTDPGLDGFIYNPPGILHAMRSGPSPFLSLWFLPL